LIKKLKIEEKEIILAKPQTFMNDSGNSVSSLLSWYKMKPQDLIVIHDDLDLPFGKIRVRFGGASGGHNGVQSVIDTIKTDKFLRIRLGIGLHHESRQRSHEHTTQYVLSNFDGGESNKVRHMIKETMKAIELITKHGYEAYISKYNK